MDHDDTWELSPTPLSLDWIDRVFSDTDCVVLNPRHETYALKDMNRHEGELYLSSLGYTRGPGTEWRNEPTTILWSRYSSWVDVAYACDMLITTVKGGVR